MTFIIFFSFFLKKFEKVEKTGIIFTKFSFRCTPSFLLGRYIKKLRAYCSIIHCVILTRARALLLLFAIVNAKKKVLTSWPKFLDNVIIRFDFNLPTYLLGFHYYISKGTGWMGSEKWQFLLMFCSRRVSEWVRKSSKMCWRSIGMVLLVQWSHA